MTAARSSHQVASIHFDPGAKEGPVTCTCGAEFWFKATPRRSGNSNGPADTFALHRSGQGMPVARLDQPVRDPSVRKGIQVRRPPLPERAVSTMSGSGG